MARKRTATAVTGAFDLTVRVWDTETGKQIRTFANVVDYTRCLAWSPDGKKVAIGHCRSRSVPVFTPKRLDTKAQGRERSERTLGMLPFWQETDLALQR